MERIAGDSIAADRARWLSELSDSLDDAQNLLSRLGTATADSPLAMELHLRIGGARLTVQALRLRPMTAFTEVIDPKWMDSASSPSLVETAL